MIDRQALLADLKPLLRTLEEDLRERVSGIEDLNARLREQHRAARDAGRTAQAYEVWRDEELTQAAVAWILACVFVRFLEDNTLIDAPWLSGPGAARQRALDRHELYFREHPVETDREYLQAAFRDVAKLPAAKALFDESHNPLWGIEISGDGAKALLGFWQRVDPDTGEIAHDFADAEWNTRFLGDLYQDLSEAAKKKYALLQTPEFVEEFILDRTLTPAIDTFGFREVRLIDPTCGSGHFLLGAFHRLYGLWARHEPGTNARELAQRALSQVAGVDLNPFAVAIARFRLLVTALRVCDVSRLADAPGFALNLATGDSLLHGKRSGELDLDGEAENLARFHHAYRSEDGQALDRILGQRYHVVVGNPPYITVKDKAQSQLYRERYRTCHRQYAVSVPFTERFFDLAVSGYGSGAAGFVGMITANSFMKREFGKKLIEEFFPRVDLTHVIDTSGAYIPGHGTPTVILLGRERPPVGETVRTVMGIRGEPATPADPSRGLVWSAIARQVDQPGSEGEFVSVGETTRSSFSGHPWTIGGGGAVAVKDAIESRCSEALGQLVHSVGFFQDTHADEAFVQTTEFVHRFDIAAMFLPQIRGQDVRDYSAVSKEMILFPYDSQTLEHLDDFAVDSRWAWIFKLRTTLWSRRTFGGRTYRQEGRAWYDYHQFPKDRARTPLSITFGEVATHNHFVFDRGGKVFNRTAPVIKLPADATVDDHLGLLGLLNSSTACFWLKQVCHNKGVGGIGGGIGDEGWEPRYQLNGTKFHAFPVSSEKPLPLARRLDSLATERQSHRPDQTVPTDPLPSGSTLGSHAKDAGNVLARMIALQEELDWRCYRLYDVMEEDLCYVGEEDPIDEPPPIHLGERAFEIAMARKIARGELQTTWFERHGSTPITELPAHWPDDYRRLIERRIALIESDRNIGLIERPEYKRRWNLEPWEDQETRALRGWLLDRLETPAYWPEPALQSTARLAGHAVADHDFMHMAALYRGHPEFDVPALVDELVRAEAVPALAVLRYKPSGLRKREVWERTWELQRQEDAIDAAVEADMQQADDETPAAFEARVQAAQKARMAAEVGDIPAPPKYKQADFLDTTSWRLRGALDVAKERFVSYPHCERAADPSLLVGWAGWNPLEQTQAIAAYYVAVKEQEGWPPERLTPLLGALTEVLPWVRQWHNDLDPEFDARMGDYFTGFVDEEARSLGLTPEQIRAWTPPEGSRKRRGRKKKASAA